MFEVITLASGSEGNSTLVRNETASFLIDAGLSAKQLTTRLLAVGLSPEQLSGILLTHEHGDHTSALRVMLSVTKCRYFATCSPAECFKISA